MILLGANDSCLKGAAGSQHVPLEDFKSNLEKIVTHPIVREQNPRVILVTPPPINEYACEEQDRSKGYYEPRRKASHTALYAEAVRRVGAEQRVTVLDLNRVFLERAGQKPDDAVLEGSKEKPLNTFLRMHLLDGMHACSLSAFARLTSRRPAYDKHSIRFVFRGAHGDDRTRVAGPSAR